MTPEEFVKNVVKTESIDFDSIRKRYQADTIIRLDHASDGLCTEAGEFKDALKKFKFYGRELDFINLVEEIGDVMWYVGIACDALRIPLSEVMQRNIAKLKARFGDEFNEEGALNRDLENERNILEIPAMFCEHANENPLRCECPDNCYCKTHTCKNKKINIVHAFADWEGELIRTACNELVEVTETTDPNGRYKNIINCEQCLR